jgi:hypothetical protein
MNIQFHGFQALLESNLQNRRANQAAQNEAPPNEAPPNEASPAPVHSAQMKAPPEEASLVRLDLDTVTPEMILHLVRHRMDDVDLQIRSRSDEVLRSTERANELSNQLQALEAIKAKTVSQGGSDPSIEYDTANGDEAHLVHLNGRSLTVAQVAAEYGLTDDLQALVKDGKVKASALNDLVKSRRQELQRTNSGNELKMMELQQLMQRRAEVLSLGTNLLRTLHEATQHIVRNVGA